MNKKVNNNASDFTNKDIDIILIGDYLSIIILSCLKKNNHFLTTIIY